MTKPSSSTRFQLSPPDPVVVLPTLVSPPPASVKARLSAAIRPAGGTDDAAGRSAGSVGETRAVPSLIALRGLVGLPDPAVLPDYSALQALVEAQAAPVVAAVTAAPAVTPPSLSASAVAIEPPTASTGPLPRKARRAPRASAKTAPPTPSGNPEPAVAEVAKAEIAKAEVAMAEPTTARPAPAEPAAAESPRLSAVPATEPPPAVPTPMAADAPEARFLDSTGEFLGVDRARLSGLNRVAEAGATSAPPFAGGLFDTATGERMVLRKPAPAHDGMNDFIAGMLARVALVDAPWVLPLVFHGDTWLASPQVSGAIDLNDYAQAAGPAAAAHGPARLLASTPAASGIARRPDSHELTRRVVRAFEQCCGKGLEENVAFAMLVGADEQHSGHFVVVLHDDRGDEAPAEGDRRVSRVVRTDCTSASREHQRLHRIRSNYFDHQMHPAPTPRRLPGFGPNQHRVDVPRDLRCGAAYIEALLVLSRLDLSEAVRLAFLEAAHSWSDDVCRAFAVNANLRLPTRRWTSEALFEECGRNYLQRIEARQKSMQRYAADLAIGLATVESQPPSHVLKLNRGPDGDVLIDAFLRQPETRPLIEAWLRREPGAARQRNLSLDRHDEALRQAVSARLDAIDR